MGRKKKDAAQEGSIATTNAASEEANEVVNDNNPTALGYEGEAELDPERAAIYDQYEKEVNAVAAPEEAGKEVAPEKKEPEEEVKTDEAAASPVEEVAEAKAPEEVAVEEKKKEETKTVPYDALHEEREKRKLAQAKTRELEERLKALEAKQAISKPVEQDNEYLTDEEKKVRELERSIAELKQTEYRREQEARQSQERTAREQLEQKLADTDKALVAEGLPGFKFLQSRVSEELNRLVAEDPDNAYLDTPEGWKKIYKEKVFPEARGMFVQADKKSLMDEKTKAKEEAALVGSPGTAPKKPEAKKEDGWSYEEYLEDRRKNSIA